MKKMKSGWFEGITDEWLFLHSMSSEQNSRLPDRQGCQIQINWRIAGFGHNFDKNMLVCQYIQTLADKNHLSISTTILESPFELLLHKWPLKTTTCQQRPQLLGPKVGRCSQVWVYFLANKFKKEKRTNGKPADRLNYQYICNRRCDQISLAIIMLLNWTKIILFSLFMLYFLKHANMSSCLVYWKIFVKT